MDLISQMMIYCILVSSTSFPIIIITIAIAFFQKLFFSFVLFLFFIFLKPPFRIRLLRAHLISLFFCEVGRCGNMAHLWTILTQVNLGCPSGAKLTLGVHRELNTLFFFVCLLHLFLYGCRSHAITYMWRQEDNLQKLVLLFYLDYLSPRCWTQECQQVPLLAELSCTMAQCLWGKIRFAYKIRLLMRQDLSLELRTYWLG